MLRQFKVCFKYVDFLCRLTRSWPQENSSYGRVWRKGRRWKKSRWEFMETLPLLVFFRLLSSFSGSNQALCNVAFVNLLPLFRWNRPPHWPRSKKSGTKLSFLLKRSLWWRRLLKVEILKQTLISEPSSDKLKEKPGFLSTWYSFALNLSILVSSNNVSHPYFPLCVTAPTEGKLDIEAIKDKVKKAKTKKLGAPPLNPAPPTSSTTDKKKKKSNKAKSKG